jgi:hypothetical protein
MGRRIAAVVLIYCCTSIAWMFLGSTVLNRTSVSDNELRNRVASTWGGEQEQRQMTAFYRDAAKCVVDVRSARTRVDADVALEPRQKGLLWYNTYRVKFAGTYTFQNPTQSPIELHVYMQLPDPKAVYDDFSLTADGKPLTATFEDKAATALVTAPAGGAVVIGARYQSQGVDSWKYSFGQAVARVTDFELRLHTNFKSIDFPENTLSPTAKRETGNGWDLGWQYKNLVSGVQIALEMPQRVQPGPLAAEISYFAPVSLLFFFFLMLMITALRGIDLHPMNYFFLAAAFFSFHLLLAYLVDHIPVQAAFFICSAVSMFLVVSYLRLAVGPQFAMREAAGVQFVYLILFSYAFFFKGFTGLTVTIGAIVTLFAVMQMTGRVRWSEKFAPAHV